MEKISIIIPCYNESEGLLLFYKKLKKELLKIKNVNFQIVFVDDGSTDSTLNIIRKLNKKDRNVKYLSFFKNYGKESAIMQGLQKTEPNYYIIMDSDMQDPPCLIEKMYKIIKNKKVDIVIAQRKNRNGENILISFFSNIFYILINKLTKFNIVKNERDFRIFNKKVKDIILEKNKKILFIKGICSEYEFKKEYLEYNNFLRIKGKSKYNLKKLFIYAFKIFFSDEWFLKNMFIVLITVNLLTILIFFII